MKHYLEFVDTSNRETFIAAEDITAIVNTDRDQCAIYCNGLSGAINVKKSHRDVITVLAEIKTLALVKFS